ncbi:MAG TPA: iron-sulfur cluster assembly accessory protein [Propionicimonas sp.]|jgi:iron-sulfur cluster assembly protein
MEQPVNQGGTVEQKPGSGTPVVRLTAKAVEAVKRTLHNQKLDSHRLRVGLRPGGCAGFQYDLDVVSEPKPGDQVFEQDGLGIAVEGKSVQYLAGTEIDYVDNGLQAGFAFANPNARSSCGCGESFQA